MPCGYVDLGFIFISSLLVILASTIKPNVVSFVNRLGKTEGGRGGLNLSYSV